MIDIKLYNAYQIGGCFTVITTSKSRIMIDYGEPLKGVYNKQEEFDWSKNKVDAVFFTHYHGDHVGKILEIPKHIPIYIGSVAKKIMLNIHKALVKVPELKEEQMKMIDLLESKQVKEVCENKEITDILGIKVTPYLVDHSAYDAYMYLIEADGKVILHTGDFRGHGYRGSKILDVIQYHVHKNGRKVDYLITEGTMMGDRKDEKVKTEFELKEEATELFRKNRYVFLVISSTNLDSLASFYKAAKANNMYTYCYNYYLYNQLKTFSETAGKRTSIYQFEDIYTIDFDKQLSHKLWDKPKTQEELMREHGFLCIIKPEKKYVDWIERFQDKNPLVIYSLWNGYIDTQKEACNQEWVDFFKPYKKSGQFIELHTSGHAAVEMIEKVIEAVAPQEAIIPIHTENAKGFEELNIKEEFKKRIFIGSFSEKEKVHMQDVRKEIITVLKQVAPGRRVTLTRNIDFMQKDNTLWIVVKPKAIGYATQPNMQKDDEAFEAWASILKTYFKKDIIKKIVLDVEIDKMPNPYEIFIDNIDVDKEFKKGHYGRFLYRAWKFKEAYDWFELSLKVEEVVDKFEKILCDNVCCNHLQKAEAGVNEHYEIRVEDSFCRNPREISTLFENIKEIKGEVYRQLYCWLRIKNTNIKLFPEGRAGLDLWNLTGNELNIFELKAVTEKNSNDKVGIISELFFYAQYCKDVFSEDAIFEKQKSEGNERGYGVLQDSKINSVNAFMLSNQYHPLISSEVIDVLNSNNSGIIYYKAPEYNIEHMLSI